MLRGIKQIAVPEDFIIGRTIAQNIIDTETGEVLANANDEITDSLLGKLVAAGIEEVQTLYINDLDAAASFRRRCAATRRPRARAARVAIYRMMRPGEPPTDEAVELLFNGLFYSDERYDLSGVGRMKFNRRVGRKDVIEYKVMVKQVPAKHEAIVGSIIEVAGGTPETVEHDRRALLWHARDR